MSTPYSEVVETARNYYNSEDADNFYFHVWGGEDIHIGIYQHAEEAIATASRRTVERMATVAAPITPETRVLDIGSGFGGAARYLAATFGCTVTCLNLSEKENARNRAMNREQGLEDRIDVRDGSFESIPLAETSVDLVWSQDAILHSGERERVIAEVARVLRPGGRFVFTDPMQTDDCPSGVLQPVLERIHLSTLGSFRFYRTTAVDNGLEEVEIIDLTEQLAVHYSRVGEVLERSREQLAGKISANYAARMQDGLTRWVEAGRAGYLRWGIMHFRKRTD
ncbi:cyclopropane-fatty-acyl-phospholipid synthase family protein [Marichromatium sp. AB31]|uniref:SAM-dependent methyltransferase n=1 Tax=Marichromatium sp. AB31 TaxID=2483362 RepID=UPI000F3E80D6|nr:methyltransferase domain-containing protein [Marichromatium sp. AB31]RNE89183.1 class I SAM-dependent methyltransferase [Marichromatium sp. AB31]